MKNKPYFHILIAALLFTLYQARKDRAKNYEKTAAAKYKTTAAVPAIMPGSAATLKTKVRNLPHSADTLRQRHDQL